MKIIFVITILFAVQPVKAQLWDELFTQKKTQKKYLLQQIAALRVYADYLRDGYLIAQEGLTFISDIKNGHFSLDKSYFQSFAKVNPALKGQDGLAHISSVRKIILQERKACLSVCNKSKMFTVKESELIAEEFTGFIGQCQSLYQEFGVINQHASVNLSDEQRKTRMWKLVENADELLNYVLKFSTATSIYALQLKQEKAGMSATAQMHGIK